MQDIILEIRETHRLRHSLHKAEKSLTLQIKSHERRLRNAEHVMLPSFINDGSVEDDSLEQTIFFSTLPFQEARELIKRKRLAAERQMAKLAKRLPIWPWVEDINGMGALGLSQIIGEVGDLNSYSNPAKLWKRMGLAVIDGKSQRKRKGAEGIAQGYSPRRRAIMYCIGDSLIKKQNRYRDIYLVRKEREVEKLPESEGGYKMLWHKRAQRYMEKQLLKDIWSQYICP